MTKSLIPPRPPAVTDLMQTRKTLEALQDYFESADGMKAAGTDFVELHSCISMVVLAMERLTVARPMR